MAVLVTAALVSSIVGFVLVFVVLPLLALVGPTTLGLAAAIRARRWDSPFWAKVLATALLVVALAATLLSGLQIPTLAPVVWTIYGVLWMVVGMGIIQETSI